MASNTTLEINSVGLLQALLEQSIVQGSAGTLMEPALDDLISRARASLAIFVSSSPRKTKLADHLINGFPSWVSSKDRKMLQSLPNEINPNVVVAKDGSGRYKTLGEAVAAAPDKSKTNLNVVDGSTTFRSATVAAVGDGFMAQDIRFQNTAGPQKHIEVALRVGADQSVINQCQIDVVVLQNCKLVARKPMDKQSNMVTAQGRIDSSQNTGTSIQSCNIASSDLQPVKGSIKTYLGRPWKEYSRTVIIQSFIDNHIDPSWRSVCSGDFALKTYYGEYMNKGAGAASQQLINE
ncbi:Pectinesterase/pectinesterase inhibitor 18 [Hibiscus syriacus]|uniref:Pectinesterase/pectinesterase inhibitor 18 n=1 Tax=Hibiscus syriacus TaxID=106335 RepID=A0A6A3CJ71_HIBSY|nr:Pectinesterase/pectinesterase inhibitor 18 [Hibiscus syriacus]